MHSLQNIAHTEARKNYQISFFFELEDCEVHHRVQAGAFGRGNAVAFGILKIGFSQFSWNS
jgi:hypothetical protein